MNQLDPVNVAIVLTAILFGPTVAGIVGPYAVILLAASVGAAWSLGRRDPSDTKIKAAWYFLKIDVTAILVTVAIANLIAKWLGHAESDWLLSPVALIIGGVGDDWPKLLRQVWFRFARLIEKRVGGNQ